MIVAVEHMSAESEAVLARLLGKDVWINAEHLKVSPSCITASGLVVEPGGEAWAVSMKSNWLETPKSSIDYIVWSAEETTAIHETIKARGELGMRYSNTIMGSHKPIRAIHIVECRTSNQFELYDVEDMTEKDVEGTVSDGAIVFEFEDDAGMKLGCSSSTPACVQIDFIHESRLPTLLTELRVRKTLSHPRIH